MTFSAKLKHYQTSITQAINRLVPSGDCRPDKLHSAMRYSLEAGGKRLRPLLVLAASELFPTKIDPFPAALSLECVHTYSLIHDDLPCMDNSSLRRGKPSCHMAYGEATALLAGDALLTLAFQILAEHYNNRSSNSSAELGIFLIQELATAAGSQKLIGGQMEDILAHTHFHEGTSSTSLPSIDINYIHLNKTAAIIACALKIGGRLCTEDKKILNTLEKIGKNLGLAFQITDDILDETSTTEILGKTAQLDIRNHKISYTKLYGLDKAKEKTRELIAEAIKLCQELGSNSVFLQELILLMAGRRF